MYFGPPTPEQVEPLARILERLDRGEITKDEAVIEIKALGVAETKSEINPLNFGNRLWRPLLSDDGKGIVQDGKLLWLEHTAKGTKIVTLE